MSSSKPSRLSAVCLLICSMCLGVPRCMTMAVDTPLVPKNILIYGGNGFIGSSTAEKLLEAGHNLTLLNRGNWYWDTAFTVRPFVSHIKCDRMQAIDRCNELVEFVKTSEKIDAVIDFSAYHPESIRDTLNLVSDKTKLYIFISTDSIYDVCDKSHDQPSLETDAVRPVTQERRDQLEGQESYGHRKLQCEEVLEEFRKDKGGPPYLSLRLPDVIGPRDNTYRWWIYQMWLRLREYLDKDVVVPASLEDTPMSLVYVNDLADLIFQVISNPNPEALDNSYNLALDKVMTLRQLLEDIRDELNLSVKILSDDKPDTIRLFPSVTSGPVDISKAKSMLGWSPTPWQTALQDTIKFYEKAIGTAHFEKARKDIIRTMQTYFTAQPYNVIRGLRDEYHLAYPESRDEL